MAISPAFAQKGKKALDWYNEYYNQDKFNSLAGEDGILTEEDWAENRTQKEAAAFGDFRWDKAINFDAKVAAAIDKNKARLNNHPQAAKKLYSNRKKLNNHPHQQGGEQRVHPLFKQEHSSKIRGR